MLIDNVNHNDNIKLNQGEIEKMRNHFPNYFDKHGKFKIEQLKEMLNQSEIDITTENYGLEFLGKEYARLLIDLEPETAISPDVVHNSNNKNSENLYIVGDNLEALHHLKSSYLNDVDCIYIDPPYNTGNEEFIYSDRFRYSKEEIMNMADISEEEAERILGLEGRNTHSAWLTFMYPRLEVAKELLSSKGIIMISIDHNENSNLKIICDEIFGEMNYIGEIIRNTNSTKNQSTFISTSHDYCLVYAKNIKELYDKHKDEKWKVPKNYVKEYVKLVEDLRKQGLSNEDITEQLKIATKYPRYFDFVNYWFIDEEGVYQKADLGGVSNGNKEPIYNPLTKEYDEIPSDGFRYSTEEMKRLIEEDEIHFHTDGSLPRLKRYLNDNLYQRPKAIMSDDQRPDDSLLKEFGTPFDNPKQLSFMKRILSIMDNDSIYLDFFGGSSTTAHAVMELNAEDGGSRKWITIQLDEEINKDSSSKSKEAYDLGFRTVDQLGRKRIDEAAKKIGNESLDLGYKLFRLKKIEGSTIDDLKEFDPAYASWLGENQIEPFSTEYSSGTETILTSWLVKDGYGLGKEIEKIDLSGYVCYKYRKTLYIIDVGIKNENINKLIDMIENNIISISRIIIYPYSIGFMEKTKLTVDMGSLKSSKNIQVVERY